MNAKNIISLSFLITALAIGYYFVIFLPEKERARQNLETQERSFKSAQEAGKSKAITECDTEMRERVNNGEFTNEIIRAAGGVQEFIDLNIENCMRKKGYSKSDY